MLEDSSSKFAARAARPLCSQKLCACANHALCEETLGFSIPLFVQAARNGKRSSEPCEPQSGYYPTGRIESNCFKRLKVYL